MCVFLCMCSVMSDLLDCSPPGSSVHGIFQARILEQVAISPFCHLQGIFPTQGLNSSPLNKAHGCLAAEPPSVETERGLEPTS